ncbi:hypothetical protein TNCV_47751 [Trichonephila clavipes]|nr:hypothetical protein TNCV_47751 [Trichonephila clavipes]
MAPGSRCMSGNTCDCRMSRTYRCAVLWCHGSILGVTMYCRQCHPIPSHQLWEWCVTVNKTQDYVFTLGSPHRNTIVITAEIESGFIIGSIPLQSSFLVRSTTPNGGVDGWVSRAAHVMVP